MGQGELASRMGMRLRLDFEADYSGPVLCCKDENDSRLGTRGSRGEGRLGSAEHHGKGLSPRVQ